jgi:hypothetical protein
MPRMTAAIAEKGNVSSDKPGKSFKKPCSPMALTTLPIGPQRLPSSAVFF